MRRNPTTASPGERLMGFEGGFCVEQSKRRSGQEKEKSTHLEPLRDTEAVDMTRVPTSVKVPRLR
jgi:hypothetical protein